MATIREQKLVQFKDGDLVHVVKRNRINNLVILDCVIVASKDGREGGELSLTEREFNYNLR
jgi:hypothetical protein